MVILLIMCYIILCGFYLLILKIVNDNHEEKTNQVNRLHDEKMAAMYHKYLIDIDFKIEKIKQNPVYIKERYTSKGESLIHHLERKKRFYEKAINELITRFERASKD